MVYNKMQVYKKNFIYSFILFISLFNFESNAQNIDSNNIQISVLVNGISEEIYTKFGHAAIRVIDKKNHSDLVYNYGIFNFSDPNFLKNFILGKLDYYVATEDMQSYLPQYIQNGQSTHEMVLNINQNEAKNIQSFLNENIKEENKYYRYDFIFNNCSSKLLDILKKNIVDLKIQSNLNPQKLSFKKWILNRYESQNLLWTKLGVNLVMGKKTFDIPNNDQLCFIPDELELYIKQVQTGNKPLLLEFNTLSNQTYISEKSIFFLRPNFILALFSAIWFLQKRNSMLNKIMNNFVFLLLGLLGLLLIFLSFFTEHVYFTQNYNILWASPLFLVLLFVKNKNALKNILKFLLVLSVIFSLTGFFQVPKEIYPLLFVLYYKLSQLNFSKYVSFR